MKYIFIFLIKVYRKILSPLKPAPCCRFYPTCSSYALQAIIKHGAIKGLYLAIGRILRCNPYNPGGIDRVPEKFSLTYLWHRNFEDKNNEKTTDTY